MEIESLTLQSHRTLAQRRRGAFSVMELVVLIAIMGVLITVVVNLVGTQPIAVRNTKLSSDLATLNQMVAVYVSDGGSLAGLTNPQTVLDKLKRSRPQSEWKRHTGPASGRLVDIRLKARITTLPEKNGQERARWNTKLQRFEITSSSGTAVSEFYLDESLATTDPGTESRTAPKVKYNVGVGKDQGWVWGDSSAGKFSYNTPGSTGGSGVSNPFDPDEDVPAPPVDPGDGGGDSGGGTGGGGGDSGGGDPTTPAATKLPTPSISPSGGSFSYTAFPGYVLISPNGAPADGSVLEYRINGAGWSTYTGTPITVSSTDKLEARNKATDTALYKNSNNASATYYRLTSGFSGSGTGTWGNATGGANLVTTVQNGEDTSTFKHGNTKLDLGNGEFLDAGVENVLTFEPNDFDTIVPNVWFEFGDLVMLNGTTFYNSEADGVTLSISLNLTEPAQTGVVHINLGLISTENTSDRLASADIVELRNPTTDFTVTVDGVEYRLELSWATQDPGAGVVQGNQFLVFEGASASAVLRGRFVSNH